MAANPGIADHYVVAYETAWTHLVQQMESRFLDKAKVKPAEGAATRFNQYATRAMSAVTSRAASTAQGADVSLPVRWAYASVYDDSALFDTWDNTFLGSVVLPTSETVQAQAYAWNRTVDTVLLQSLVSSGYQTSAYSGSGFGGATMIAGGGVAPTISTVAFDYANQAIAKDYVPFGGTAVTSGMTIAKIRRAKRKLDAAEVTAEGRCLALGAKELEDLLATTEVTNSLYNSVRALTDGDVNHFLGFDIVRTELLPWFKSADNTYGNATDVASTGLRTAIAWQKDMVGLVNGGKKAFMDVLPTQSHALQIRTTSVIGAARLQEKGVVAIVSDSAA